jgi:alpha-1,3-rhamnosyl/mannosyltransferase
MLPESARARAPLALVGPAGWRIAKLEARIDALERAGQLKRLCYVPDADRALLYAGALGLAYPSLYEGFGLPPLEAAACGAPVLTSRNSPMEEILGETAILADPLDVDDIHDGLTRLLDDHDIRAHALRSASNWTGQFSWAACVDRTAAVYRELA